MQQYFMDVENEFPLDVENQNIQTADEAMMFIEEHQLQNKVLKKLIEQIQSTSAQNNPEEKDCIEK